jgi:hypothetical protein
MLGGATTSFNWTFSVWIYNTAQFQDTVGSYVFNGGDLLTEAGPLFYFAKTIGQVKWTPTITIGEGGTAKWEWGPATGDSVWYQDAWTHVLCSVNGATQTARVYINDVDNGAGTWGGAPAAKLNTDVTRWTVGDRYQSASPYNDPFTGGIACLWMDLDSYIDITVTANRRMFIDSSGNPVDLGNTGVTTGGHTPHIWLHNDDPAAWYVNYGLGNVYGQFVPSTTLTRFGSTSPGDCTTAAGTIRHSLLEFTDLHEPKGVSAATIDSVFIANGEGTGAWIAHPKVSSTPSGGGAGIPAPVTLTTPTSYTVGSMVCSGNATDVGMTVATGPHVTQTRDTTHVVDCNYTCTVAQTNASAQDVYITWKHNTTVLEEYTQKLNLAQNVKASVSSNILLEMADGDTLQVVFKVAAGNITLDNLYVTCVGLPTLESV